MSLQKSPLTKLMTVAGISFLMMLTAGSAKAFQNDGNPYLSKKFSINTPGKLKVRTSGGAIKVVGSEGNHVRVEMYVSKNGKNLAPSDTKLNHFNIQIEKNGNTIIASAKRKNSSWWKFWKNHNISISFVVHTPHKMDVSLRTSGGHIITTGLTGKLNMRTSGGYLKLESLKGNIHASTSGGHIALTNLSGNIKVRTSGGYIKASNISGVLKAKTSGGRISARNIDGQMYFHTSGGNIHLKDIAGSVSASTSGGDIIAQLTQIKGDVKLRTSGGNINIKVPKNIGLDLELRGSGVHTGLRNFSGTVKDNRVEGTINGGGPELSAHTSGGSVSISYE